MNHLSPTKLILAALLAVVLLAGIAYTMQKPEMLSHLPFLAPTPTPTPLASQNIVLYSPRIHDQVSQKIIIKGKARVFENVVSVRLKEKITGKVYGVITTTTDAQDAGQFGNFQAGILLTDSSILSGTEFIIEVYQASPKDGSDLDKISVPVTFTPTADQ